MIAGFVCGAAVPGAAQDVALTAPDGAVEISGNPLGFDGEFYRADTRFGELTVDGSGVLCDGPGCPDLPDHIARLGFSGAATMAAVLLPALAEGFALRNELRAERLGGTGARSYRAMPGQLFRIGRDAGADAGRRLRIRPGRQPPPHQDRGLPADRADGPVSAGPAPAALGARFPGLYPRPRS